MVRHGIAPLRGLVAVKLPGGVRNRLCSGLQQSIVGIHEQQHRCHESRESSGQFGRTIHRDGSGAGRIQHKAHGIRTGLHHGIHVRFAGESTDLDAGTHGGS